MHGYVDYMADLVRTPPSQQQQQPVKRQSLLAAWPSGVSLIKGYGRCLYHYHSEWRSKWDLRCRSSAPLRARASASQGSLCRFAGPRPRAALEQCCPKFGQFWHEGPVSRTSTAGSSAKRRSVCASDLDTAKYISETRNIKRAKAVRTRPLARADWAFQRSASQRRRRHRAGPATFRAKIQKVVGLEVRVTKANPPLCLCPARSNVSTMDAHTFPRMEPAPLSGAAATLMLSHSAAPRPPKPSDRYARSRRPG